MQCFLSVYFIGFCVKVAQMMTLTVHKKCSWQSRVWCKEIKLYSNELVCFIRDINTTSFPGSLLFTSLAPWDVRGETLGTRLISILWDVGGDILTACCSFLSANEVDGVTLPLDCSSKYSNVATHITSDNFAGRHTMWCAGHSSELSGHTD